MLNKYELAEDWYNRVLAQVGSETETLKLLIAEGLYDKQELFDSPQDRELQRIENANILFITKMLLRLDDEMHNLSLDNVINEEDTYNQAKNFNDTKVLPQWIDYSLYVHETNPSPLSGHMNLNSHRLKQIADPTDDKDAINKQWADTNIDLAVDDTTDTQFPLLFKKDGSVTATGDFRMGDKKIINLADPANNRDAVPFKWADQKTIDFLNGGNFDMTPYFKMDGSVTATGNFNLGNHNIISLADPINPNDIVTLNSFDQFSRNRTGQYGGFKADSESPYKGLRLREPDSSAKELTVPHIPDGNDQGGWAIPVLRDNYSNHSHGSRSTITLDVDDRISVQITDSNGVVNATNFFYDRGDTDFQIFIDPFSILSIDGRPQEFFTLPITGLIGKASLDDMPNYPDYIYAKIRIDKVINAVLSWVRLAFQDQNLTLTDLGILKTCDVKFNGSAHNSSSPYTPFDTGVTASVDNSSSHRDLELHIYTNRTDWSQASSSGSEVNAMFKANLIIYKK